MVIHMKLEKVYLILFRKKLTAPMCNFLKKSVNDKLRMGLNNDR